MVIKEDRCKTQTERPKWMIEQRHLWKGKGGLGGIRQVAAESGQSPPPGQLECGATPIKLHSF